MRLSIKAVAMEICLFQINEWQHREGGAKARPVRVWLNMPTLRVAMLDRRITAAQRTGALVVNMLTIKHRLNSIKPEVP